MIDLKSLSNSQLSSAIELLKPPTIYGYAKTDMVRTLEDYKDKKKLMKVLDLICNGFDYFDQTHPTAPDTAPAQLPPPAAPSTPTGGGSLDQIVAGMVHGEVEKIKAEGVFTSKTIILHDAERKEMKDEVLPEEFEQVMQLVSLRKNIMLVGPTGCGKTHLARAVSRARPDNDRFGSLSVTFGMSKSDLLGQLLPVGESARFHYIMSMFVDLYENGGTFLLDEIDNGDPNTFGIINQAVSNNEFWLPMRPEKPHVERHKDFVLIAAANTYGTGADMQYVGRAQLDRATLDRFKSGVVEMDYSPAVEKAIIDPEVLRWGRKVRKNIEKFKLQEVMSTRYMVDMTDLKKAYEYTVSDWEDIFFQGVSEEDQKRLRT